MLCEYGHGFCTAPNTKCPHWIGIVCELDEADENVIVRDCHKCVYEVGCHGNPVGCKGYKRDAPDGGYYGENNCLSHWWSRYEI